MTLKALDPCCSHPEHATPYRNEEGWVLTGFPDDSSTWEAFLPHEWKAHCDANTATQKRVPMEVRLRIAQRIDAGEQPIDLAHEYGIGLRTVQRYRTQYGKGKAA